MSSEKKMHIQLCNLRSLKKVIDRKKLYTDDIRSNFCHSLSIDGGTVLWMFPGEWHFKAATFLLLREDQVCLTESKSSMQAGLPEGRLQDDPVAGKISQLSNDGLRLLATLMRHV
jgi:hypothetical protein